MNKAGRPKGSYSYTYRKVSDLEKLGVKSALVRGVWWRAMRSEEMRPKAKTSGRPKGAICGHRVTVSTLQKHCHPSMEIPVLAKWVEKLEA